ncbi:MAG: ABC transporter ATP-binding protein [Chloroflexi bacterium]|nr:ABC transporter ATP-binding protein [Chloroflexota bacterium]
MISISNLTHSYRSHLALRDVTLTIEAGEFFGLFGPNGAGKTTLIRILSTLVIPSSGTARVHDLDVVRHADAVRSQIGLVFGNENSFYGRLSGRQNLEFFAALQNLGWEQSRRRAADLLALFDLTVAADSAVQSYSTGMRQRINVARALLHDPKVIFLDEPTKGMDILAAESLRMLLRKELVEQQHKTILLTTHDLQEMELLCDRVGILDHGQLRGVGAPGDLIREANQSVVYRLEIVGEANRIVQSLSQLPSVESVTLISPSILDLTLKDSIALDAEVWQVLAAHDVKVKRCAPRDDGLVNVLKRTVNQ